MKPPWESPFRIKCKECGEWFPENFGWNVCGEFTVCPGCYELYFRDGGHASDRMRCEACKEMTGGRRIVTLWDVNNTMHFYDPKCALLVIREREKEGEHRFSDQLQTGPTT